MTPVELNRLRAALEAAEDIVPSWVQPAIDAAQAVLDAPTVWWCQTNNKEAESELWAGSIRCAGCYSDLSDDDDCGERALVPVFLTIEGAA